MGSMQEQTVFVVDDDDAVRDSIQELVESVGLQAKRYESAQAFLDAYRPQCPGCLVLDVRMAERNSTETTQPRPVSISGPVEFPRTADNSHRERRTA
jgi:FixJ family two-component response regulator